MKPIFDILISSFCLVVLSPILLICIILIKLNDGGPVFYQPKRTGFKGKSFQMFKFRTMVVNADKIGPSSTTNSDSRLTSIGQLLRRYKLDELPQLINVLRGDMSIVGPRPEVKRFTDMYTAEEKAILTVKPGITDFASIWNSDEGSILEGSADPDKTYMEVIRPTKIRLQLKYVKEKSFLTDVKIIFVTFRAIFFKPASHEIKE